MKRIASFWGLLAFAALAHAQNQVSWVASTGFDANTCIRTSPCRTFTAAYAKTDAGGTIRVVDAADYGQLTISKTLTVDGGTSGAFIEGFANDGITLTPGAGDIVNIRNLAVHTSSQQKNGIVMFLGGGAVVNIEDVSVTTFSTDGILAVSNGNDSGTTTQLNLRNVSVKGAGRAIALFVGQFTADRVLAHAAGIGLILGGNVVNASVRDSVFQASGGNAFVVTSDATTQSPKLVMIERCEMSQSVQGLTAVQNPQAPAVTVRLSNSVITNDLTGINQIGGATVISFRNNVIAANSSDGTPPLTTSLK